MLVVFEVGCGTVLCRAYIDSIPSLTKTSMPEESSESQN
jgi:hypothetical protein